MGFVTDMKTGVVRARQRCVLLSRCAAMFASEDAFEGILFDSWLCCFAVVKLRGHEHITFRSGSASEEMGQCLMAVIKQEKLFYPNRANWGEVNHAEMSKVRWFILTVSSDQGGGCLCRNHHKDK